MYKRRAHHSSHTDAPALTTPLRRVVPQDNEVMLNVTRSSVDDAAGAEDDVDGAGVNVGTGASLAGVKQPSQSASGCHTRIFSCHLRVRACVRVGRIYPHT